MFDHDPGLALVSPNLMSDRTVWQRLQEYRNHDKVQVITPLGVRGQCVVDPDQQKGRSFAAMDQPLDEPGRCHTRAARPLDACFGV